MDMFDRLNDDLIIHILSFLPTKLAVLTSVLSKRWQFLWCFANNSIIFDDFPSFYNHFGPPPPEGQAQAQTQARARARAFHNFIDRVLKLNKTPEVDKFFLTMDSFLQNYDLDLWIHNVVNKRKAKEIEITFGYDALVLTTNLFLPLHNSSTLRVLKLHSDKPFPFIASEIKTLFLPNLNILHFWSGLFNLRWWLLIYLFRASPNLQVAYIGGNDLGNCKLFLNIYAPSLKTLHMKFKSIDSSNKFLINAPILEELKIVDRSFHNYVIKSNCLVKAKLDIGLPFLKKVQRLHVHINRVSKLLCRISNVKFLNLKAHTVDALSIGFNHKHVRSFQFLSLRCLKLCFINYSSWDFLPKLLDCSPNLEVLVLSKDFKGKDAEFIRDSTWVQPSSVPACLLSCLRQVEVWDCDSHQVEYNLISYLLKHGEVLTTFLVELLPANSREDLRFREKLMEIPRVSGTCKLKFIAHPHSSQHNRFSPDVEGKNTQELQQRTPPQKLSFEDLRLCTNYFNDENLIARTKKFKIYRGKLHQSDAYDSVVKDVVVKKWVIPAKRPYNRYKEASLHGFHEELKLLQHPNFNCHPYFMDLLGYCVEDNNERLGVVYDFKSMNYLENLIPKDSFTWLQRIKVMLLLACILEYMHKKHGDLPSVTPKVNPANVILDKDYVPMLFNFNQKYASDVYREEDEYEYPIGNGFPESRNDKDVWEYGLTLMALISKRIHRWPVDKRYTSECSVTLYKWAMVQYDYRHHITSPLCKSLVPLVHTDLVDNPTYDLVDGLKLSRLAMRCLGEPAFRPSMFAVVKYLCKLRVVKDNWDVIDSDNVISNHLNAQIP